MGKTPERIFTAGSATVVGSKRICLRIFLQVLFSFSTRAGLGSTITP